MQLFRLLFFWISSSFSSSVQLFMPTYHPFILISPIKNLLEAICFFMQSCTTMEQKELLQELAESVGAMA